MYTPKVVSASEDESLLEGAERLVAAGIGSLAVTREGEVVGILTERDLCSRWPKRPTPKQTRIAA